MKQKGFTLIELLVVVAIIGTLSSIVISSVSAAREKAKEKAVFAQLREVKKAVTEYQTDKNFVASTGSPYSGSVPSWYFIKRSSPYITSGAWSSSLTSAEDQLVNSIRALSNNMPDYEYCPGAGPADTVGCVLFWYNASMSTTNPFLVGAYQMYINISDKKGICISSQVDTPVIYTITAITDSPPSGTCSY